MKSDRDDIERKMIDDVKTAIEHDRIISAYRETGILNRDDATTKYSDFNAKYPEYCIAVNIKNAVSGYSIYIDSVSDSDIVDNLQGQLNYLIAKITKDRNNG